jgi:hypothetical protein
MAGAEDVATTPAMFFMLKSRRFHFYKTSTTL